MSARYKVVTRDINGKIIAVDRFFFRRSAEKRAALSNLAAREVPDRMRLIGLKPPAPQMYFATVEKP